MTKHDLSQIKPIPGFDCVKAKHDAQAKIYEETKDMTPEEVRAYYRKESEWFREKMEEYRRKKEENNDS
jgi:hypothetical protein